MCIDRCRARGVSLLFEKMSEWLSNHWMKTRTWTIEWIRFLKVSLQFFSESVLSPLTNGYSKADHSKMHITPSIHILSENIYFRILYLGREKKNLLQFPLEKQEVVNSSTCCRCQFSFIWLSRSLKTESWSIVWNLKLYWCHHCSYSEMGDTGCKLYTDSNIGWSVVSLSS